MASATSIMKTAIKRQNSTFRDGRSKLYDEEDDWLLRDMNTKDRTPASLPLTRPDSLENVDPEQAIRANDGRTQGKDLSTLDEDDQILEIKSARFYRWSIFKELFFLFICISSGGIVLVACFIWPQFYGFLRFVEVHQDDERAERVLVESVDELVTLVHIQTIYVGENTRWIPASKARFSSGKLMKSKDRMFVWREERFWYNHVEGSWTRRAFNVDVTYTELHSIASQCALREIGHGVERNQKFDFRKKRLLVYGSNQLRVTVPNFGRILVTEVFRPFFLFQVFSIAFWIYQDYRIYAYVILGMTTISILFNVLEIRKHLQSVKKLAASECNVTRLGLAVNEEGEVRMEPQVISSSELLPGDIIEIEAGMIFPCDLVLLAGQCVVNESMLTGESAPVPKTPVPSGFSATGQEFKTQSERDGKYKLLSGTLAVQIKASPNPHLHSYSESSDKHDTIWQFLSSQNYHSDHRSVTKEQTMPVAAMVINTAYGTAKGQLVRAIRFPKPSKYDFERKIYYFVANLVVYLIVVCAATVIFLAGKESARDIVERCLNLLTIAVPPALPLALAIGVSVSFKRLQGKGIFCINPARIVSAGRVDTLCFDKTGTLTEDGLNLKGVVPVMESDYQTSSSPVNCGELEENLHSVYLQGHQALLPLVDGKSVDKPSVSFLGLFYTLAACHSISTLDQPDGGSTMVETGNPARNTNFMQRLRDTFKHPPSTKKIQTGPEGISQNRQEGQAWTEYLGDPMEVQMFASTGWIFETRPSHTVPGTEKSSDSSTMWRNVPSSVDTIIMPPPKVKSPQVLAILRRFDFDSELRMMSSIILELPSATAMLTEARSWILVKGAPESLQEVCRAETLPHTFSSQLKDLTLKGYRVLACAYRLLGSLSINEMMVTSRKQMETDLIFCGFLIMENKLKPETSGVLLQLAQAALREIMVTGDNPFTAISVARQCGPFFLRPSAKTYLIDRAPDLQSVRCKSGCVLKSLDSGGDIDVDSLLVLPSGSRDMVPTSGSGATLGKEGGVNLVVTGRAFSALSIQHNQLIEEFMEQTHSTHVKVTEYVTPLQKVLTQANIFSRMSPQNKHELMRSLQDLGYAVCMTGDGANDSGALKAADVGISIASKPLDGKDAMAAGPSIAAPFSTKLAHIGAVTMVLAQGRCALVNATIMFKYMYFYALIQATSVIILYRYQLELYDYQYLWADLALVFPMVLFMPTTHARRKLSRGKPESNLLALPVLLSVYGHSVLIILFQIMAQFYLQQQSWYEKVDSDSEDPELTADHNYNSTVSFLFASFQYVSLAMTLSQSFGTFRRSPLTNIPLTASLICQFILSSIFMLKPPSYILSAFSLVDLSGHEGFLFGLWLLALANSLLFIVFERYAVSHRSTELEMSAKDEETDYDHMVPKPTKVQKRLRLLKGEDHNWSPGKPVVRDFIKVAEISKQFWARLP